MANSSKSATALRKILQNNKASDVDGSKKAGKGGVVELDSTMEPIEAANVLWQHNVLGAPVWDDSRKRYVGFFDMRDILSATTQAAKEYQKQKEKAIAAAAAVGGSGDEDEMAAEDEGGDGNKRGLLRRYNSLVNNKLGEMKLDGGGGKQGGAVLGTQGSDLERSSISYLAAKNPFHYCLPDTSLEDLCRVLYEHKCHRVPIVQEEGGRCTGIVSQSALVKFLSSHVKPGDLEETLAEANLEYRKQLVSVVDTTPAFDAFDMLDRHKLSGIGVVDEEGVLVGNTSARDIKLAAIDEGKTAMDVDILSYLAYVRQATPCKNERYPSCHVHEDATVGHVINLLAKTGYHRVFVVDSDVRPIGVISVADIVRFANGEKKAE